MGEGWRAARQAAYAETGRRWRFAIVHGPWLAVTGLVVAVVLGARWAVQSVGRGLSFVASGVPWAGLIVWSGVALICWLLWRLIRIIRGPSGLRARRRWW
jgi:hypothetical protein